MNDIRLIWLQYIWNWIMSTKKSLLHIILSSYMTTPEAVEKVALVTLTNPPYLHSL